MATNKNESRITYENVFSDSVDIQYTVLPGKVKENIVLDQKVGFESYTMSIICEGLSAVITEENCVEFLDANKEPQYIIQAPYMYDDIYEISYDIEMNLVATDEGYDITIFPDQDWLNSEERVYPIVIDPTVRTNTTKSNFSDTYIFQGSGASSSRAFEERLRVGIYNGKKYKALWKATNLPSIPQYAAIVSATFNLKLPDVTTTSRNFSIYKINSSWESDTVTWAQSGEMTYTLLQSNVKRNSENDTVTFSGTNLTNAVKSWYSGTANNGFIFRYTDESFDDPDYNVFYSSDNTTSTSYMPYLTVTYSYGAAKAYRSVTDPNTNCLGYALELYLSPGLAMYNNESVTTVFNRMESLVESKYDKNIRKLGTTDRLNTNEYLVAMRVGTHTVGNDIVVDYHFMVQLNNGYWAHKAGFLPSANLGNINPTTYTWNLFNTAGNVIYSNFYSSETIYFAVS